MPHLPNFYIPRKIFLLTGVLLFISSFAFAQLVINEVSQGPSGTKEYVELVVVGTPTCAGIPCLDLRGYYVDDNNGNHATGSGTGIASGCIRFTTNALWSCVPIGTIIVIYNDGDMNAAIPAADLSLTDGNCRLVIPVSNCTLLEKHTSLPSTANASYPTTGFSSCGSWTNISMANGDDSFQSIDPSGTLVHSVSWGNNTLNPIIYFTGSAAGKVAWNNNSVNTNPSLQGNWSFTTVAGNETPGVPNNAANAAWIASMNNNCTPVVPLAATITSTNASCSCTGTATVSPSGGIAPYTFLWSPSGGSSSTASSLCAGTYTCIITDAAGCTQTPTVTITAAGMLSISATSTSVTCNGSCNGSATVNIITGTAPFTFSWSPSGGNNATATGLCAGNYTCTVTDASGCTGTQTFAITQPAALTVVSSQTNINCNSMNTGAASVSVSGGTPGYSYSWAPSGGNAAAATGLTAGSYTSTITDLNGCTITQSFLITQPSALTATRSQTTINCNGGTASASVVPSGGTPPYSFAWTPSGGNAATATGLTAGSYSCTITDANGCNRIEAFTITQPNALVVVPGTLHVTCNGGNNGAASALVSGGTPGYSYSWSPTGGTSFTASSLSAGGYTCTITDMNGCSTTQTFLITEPPQLTATTNQTNVSCNGGNSGSATVFPSGGTPGYSFLWSPSGGNAAAATGLTAGSYTNTITDVNGCTLTQSFLITQPSALTATTSQTTINCNGGTASASVVPSGGTPPYSFAWTPSGGNSATATGLTAGSYSCTITDANGCNRIETVTITQPNAFVIIASESDITCNGGNNGSASVVVSGGTPGYSYLWSPSGGTSSSASSLVAGTYTCTITDNNGCSTTQTFSITQPNAIAATTVQTNVSCNGGNNGSATVTPSGGTPGYSYSWSPTGGTNASASSLAAGTYTCVITDANGCTHQEIISITQPATLVTTATQTNISCNGANDGSATVNPSGGTPAYTYAWTPAGGTAATANFLPPGNYSCTITDQSGCTVTQTFLITEPSALLLSTSSTPSNCTNPDGSVSVVESGGNGPYTYAWSPGSYITATVNGVPAGNYSVTVTDQNGCAANATVTVSNVNGVVASLTSQTNVNCFGQSTGAIYITQNGGTPGYTYTWSPNISTADSATSITAGNYSVTVTDANGCTSSLSVTITEPPLLSVIASANPSGVCSGSSVQLNAVASGGIPSYNYTWNPGNMNVANPSIVATTSGTFSVTATDQNGCNATAQVNVTVFQSPSAAFTVDTTFGCAPVCVDFSDASTIASPATIVSWDWDFGDGNNSSSQNPSHCFSASGSYPVQLTISSNDGCNSTILFPALINVFASPVAAFTFSPVLPTILNPQIFFTDASLNATSWNWSFGDLSNSSSNQQNPSFIYSEPVCYQVTLTVSNSTGCSDNITQEVCIDPEVTLFVPNAFTPDGDGNNDIFNVSGEGLTNDNYELLIFDRWGNLIFESHALENGWDGKVRGKSDVSQVDTYVWKLSVTDAKSQPHYLQGHVNLLK